MADNREGLSGDDLARPAKHLPLKVIRELGRKLHRQLLTSGNWETVAEELGYGFEEIQQFSSLSRQDLSPGETMLLDWVQRANGCTLFVLRSALLTVNRQDCVEYLDQEIYDKVICMDLLLCIKDETTRQTDHKSVRTRSDTCLLESLHGVLDEPIREQYILLDSNVSWVNTSAREFKGRELMLLKKLAVETAMEQDPTIDSSNPNLGSSNRSDDLDQCTQGFDRRQVTRRPVIPPRTSRPVAATTHGGSTYISAQSNSISSNDLSQNRGYQGTSRNAFIPNICQHERSRPDANIIPGNILPGNNDSVKPKMPSGMPSAPAPCHCCSTNPEGGHSDEYNGSYSTSSAAHEKQLISRTHRLVDENDDSSGDDIEVIASYQDASSAMFNSKELYRETCVRDGHGVICSSSLAEPSSVAMSSRLAHCNSSCDKGNTCSYDNEDITCYEDPSDHRVEPVGDTDPPVYQYARDLSLGRKDSITKLKEVVQTQYRAGRSNTDFQSDGRQSIFSKEQVTSCFSGQMDSRETHGSITYSDDRFSDEPVYNDNGSMVYNDFDVVNEDRKSNGPDRFSSNLSDVNFTPPVKTLSNDMDHSEYIDSFNTDIDHDNYIDSDTIADGLAVYQYGRECDGLQREPVDISDDTLKLTRQGLDSGYIDFNKYPQTDEFSPSQAESETLRDRNIAQNRNSGFGSSPFHQGRSTHFPESGESDTLKRVRFAANRCMSEIERSPSTYETLNRQTSCPNFDYTSSLPRRSLPPTDFSTIADAFSLPSSSIRRGSSSENGVVEDNQDFLSERQFYGKRNSYPLTNPTAHVDKFKFARRSMPLMRNQSNHRPLPEIPEGGRRNHADHPRRSGSRGSTSVDADWVSDDTYKIVVGGKSSRTTMADRCLANDHLFMHYNRELRGHTGWSPKENEYTIDKTMAEVKNETGLYILWYHRSKKNLIISVTRAGELLHFRVRQKVIEKQLYFFVSRAMIVPNVTELLDYCQTNGLPMDNREDVRMRLPVSVRYDRIPVDV